ncbi:hypothetical protein [Parendozoicomonas sp. Alg238-R29]|uniref:hypothetical protein n=1 Tax=Parendozoicomonas sp. Alg238-R29 TaxID=2993446 RepID=UPI00248EBC8B|nr:hypothetical protein [Parendozoicomonas sp. Alg238-R29]
MATQSASNSVVNKQSTQPGHQPGKPSSTEAGKSAVAPFATTSNKSVMLCPECKGHGYDPEGLFFNGGLRRPCGSCLLVGFVYADTGERLTDNDAITVMRQSQTQMIARNEQQRKEICKLEAKVPKPSMAEQVYPHNERGPFRSKYAGD